MLAGLYRSNNPNLHDFRPPAGIVSSAIHVNGSQSSKMLNRGQSTSTLNSAGAISIIKPLDFTTLKGHMTDKERAYESQQRYQKNFVVLKGSNYASKGPPPAFTDAKPLHLSKELGPGFRTTFKDHNEVARIREQ